MTRKKIEQYKNLENFMKLNGRSNQLQHVNKRNSKDRRKKV